MFSYKNQLTDFSQVTFQNQIRKEEIYNLNQVVSFGIPLKLQQKINKFDSLQIEVQNMSSLAFRQKDPLLQIVEDQVNKFYKQRELKKRQMLNSFSTQKDNNDSHPAFKNLFRRKSLANKIKQDSSMFESFNHSFNETQILRSNTLNKNQDSLIKLDQSLQSVNFLKQPKNISFPKKFNYFKASESQSSDLHQQYTERQFQQRQIKKRCTSVQLENSSYSLRNQSLKSLQNLKPLKQTVPLSSILRKYQQEVNKIQKQGIEFNNDKEFSRKIRNAPMFSEEKNKQNSTDFETQSKVIQQKYLNSKQNLKVRESIKLPEVVEQCIDKWKKLQIQQIKAEQELKYEKHIKQVNKIQNDTNNVLKTQKDLKQPQRKDEIQRLKLQYEQKLQQQQEKIQNLQKQNNHYKKFVSSIQKMKVTLQKVQNNDFKPDEKMKNPQTQLSSKKNSSKSKQKQNQNDFNLKQLWRWIKSLPNAKVSNKKLQVFIR